jgi:prevent-host-death family protein
MTITIDDIEHPLLQLLRIVAKGEEICIAKEGRTIAKIVPVQDVPLKPIPQRVLGMDADKDFWISEDFDAPLPEKIQRYFE